MFKMLGKTSPILLRIAAALMLATATLGSAPVSKWTNTQPPINETHIFHGEINRRGTPVGYHSRPDGEDPSGARVVRVTAGPNEAGVYEAIIQIRNPRTRKWLQKRSTFYPDAMSREEVIEAVLNAFNNGRRSGNSFRGPSGRGFTISGYTLNDGRINTAYPLYVRD